jgi:addiction module HigA family antidote
MATRKKAHSKKRAPVHPGNVLKLEFLEPLGISAHRLAEQTGISARHLGRLLTGTRGVSADDALRLSRFFGTSARVWLNLQVQYDLDVAEDAVGSEIARRVKPWKAA